MPEIAMSPAVIWAVAGVTLIIVELMTVTFVFAFLGVGALITALASWTGITPTLNGQIAVFAVSSLLMTLAFRKTAKKLFFASHEKMTDYKGQVVTVVKAIPPGGEGAISYRGSEWIAFSESAETIREGSTVEIVSLDGIRAKVASIK